jgi:outer membrane lipoprotein carrier protein
MRFATSLLAVAFALLAALPARADGAAEPEHAATGDGEADACLRSAVDAIQRRYASIRDLSARFTQTSRSVALGTGASSTGTAAKGTVVFAKPDKMRWSYEEPEPSLVVSDGETLWLYDPGRREVQRLGVADDYLSGAAIQFLLGQGDVFRDFRVRAESCSPAAARLELVPRRAASYERLRIRVDSAAGEILETAVVDLLGNVTEVAFAGIRVNLDPDPELFRFEPPAGVRVIELEAPSGAEGRPE